MSGVSPPTLPTPGTASGSSTTPGTTSGPTALASALLERLPERLQGLTRAVTLPGTVLDQTAGGLAQVRTALGDVHLRTSALLSPRQPVLLQLAPSEGGGSSPQGLLLTPGQASPGHISSGPASSGPVSAGQNSAAAATPTPPTPTSGASTAPLSLPAERALAALRLGQSLPATVLALAPAPTSGPMAPSSPETMPTPTPTSASAPRQEAPAPLPRPAAAPPPVPPPASSPSLPLPLPLPPAPPATDAPAPPVPAAAASPPATSSVPGTVAPSPSPSPSPSSSAVTPAWSETDGVLAAGARFVTGAADPTAGGTTALPGSHTGSSLTGGAPGLTGGGGLATMSAITGSGTLGGGTIEGGSPAALVSGMRPGDPALLPAGATSGVGGLGGAVGGAGSGGVAAALLWGQEGGALAAGARFAGAAAAARNDIGAGIGGGVGGGGVGTGGGATGNLAQSTGPAGGQAMIAAGPGAGSGLGGRAETTAALAGGNLLAGRSGDWPGFVAIGGPVALRLLAFAGPGQNLPIALTAGLPAGTPVLTGTIAGTTANGNPVLATPRGSFALAAPLAIPAGTQMAVAVTDPATALSESGATLAARLAGHGEASDGSFPALRQILATLATLDRAAMQGLLDTAMPRPNRRLGAAMSFFLAAARGGDATSWLGDEVTRSLEKAGRHELLRLLTEEFRALARQQAETPPGEWKSIPIPFHDGTQLSHLQVRLRPVNEDERENAAREKRARGSRFLIDLDLSRFGPLQLDGLVRPQRFDLIIRSRTPLPDTVRQELPALFTANLEAVGFTGSLGFQSGERGWIAVPPKGQGVQHQA